MKNRSIGSDAGMFRSCRSRLSWHVLELEGDCLNAARKRSHTVKIRIRRSHLHIRDLTCGRVIIRRVSVDAIAHSPGSDSKHPTELAASEYTDHSTGKDGLQGSVS
jgi:hypothetical protein